MSAAVVTGVATLIYASNENAVPNQVKISLLNSAKHYKTLEGYISGARFLNSKAAIDYYNENY